MKTDRNKILEILKALYDNSAIICALERLGIKEEDFTILKMFYEKLKEI